MMDVKYMLECGLADTMTDEQLADAGISEKNFNKERQKAKKDLAIVIQKRIDGIRRKYKR